MEYGIWNMEYGIWNMEYGIWNMEYGIWNMEYGIRYFTFYSYSCPNEPVHHSLSLSLIPNLIRLLMNL
jgi:hypothetical protein